ncbi:MAG: MFS transporter [Pseudomonadales bacterium]
MHIPNFKQFLAFSIIGTVCLMPLLVLPAMIGVLVDNAGMSDSSAGWSSSAHFFAAAAIGLLLSLRMHRINLRQIGTWTLALAVVADIASALTAGESVSFFAARVAAGFMLGASYICSVGAFARFDGYERGFGLFVTLQFIVSGLGLYLVPVYADQMGADGLFAGLAVLDAVALLLARYLPSETADHQGEQAKQSEMKTLLTMTAILAIVGFALFEAANNAQFAYIERFGVALHIPDENIGFSLLIASLIGIPGAFAVVLIGPRFGTLGPLLFGIAIAITGLITLINAESYTAYFIGSCCMGFSWAYCLPFIQSLLASIDRNGSAIAAGSSLSTFGSAVGPGIAAVVVSGGKYENVFLLSIGLFAATVATFVYANRAMRKNA